MDPITRDVIAHALTAIAEEMGVNLYQASRSTIIREVRDIGTAIFDVDGHTVAMANWIPMLSNALEPAIQAIKKHYDIRALKPDEALLTNDPFDGGQHVNDILLYVPVHYEGQVIALACANVHHLDVGGGAPASYSGATEVYHEGIVFPPLKVQLGPDWMQSPFGRIFGANIRSPDKTLPDFDAQLAACWTGRRRILELVEKYGRDDVLGSMREIQLYSERLMRQAVSEIPDGDYSGEAYMEDDGTGKNGPFTIRVTVRVRGDELVVDFSGTDPQAKGFINIPLASTFSTVRTTIMSILGIDIRSVTAGAFRPIRVEAPLGCLANPRRPAATRARTSTCYKIFDAINHALAEVLPTKVTAPGFDCQTGVSLAHRGENGMSIFSEALGAGNGGLYCQDGADGMIMHLTNATNTPVEAVEIEHPFLQIERYALVKDSGGAGMFRGGMGIERVYRILEDGVVFGLHSDRHHHAAEGLFGGLPGQPGYCAVTRDTETVVLGSKVHITLQKGEVLTVRTGGGAGYGIPHDRDSIRIETDVREERISPEAAERDYKQWRVTQTVLKDVQQGSLNS